MKVNDIITVDGEELRVARELLFSCQIRQADVTEGARVYRVLLAA